MKDRLGFIPPRYGAEVIGGAEAVIREVAQGLAARGWEVEVLTTCARDHFTWANEYPTGVSEEDGLSVRRFPTVLDTGRRERARYEQAIHNGWPLTLVDQQRWMNDDLRVPELYHHLLDHSRDYRALVFAPYLFWTTFACSQIAPERTILMPCLHDEPYAALEIFQPVFSGPAGLWFLSEPEHEVAHRLFSLPPNHEVVGAGVRVPAVGPDDVADFRSRHGLGQDDRLLLFAGRREGGKGWERLLAGFARALRHAELPFRLVTMGVGKVRPPPEIADRVVDLGFLPDSERDAAFAAVDAYLQPSAYESFSRTVMEAWLAGTLVIANGASEVVAWHCERSGAGLTYDDDDELEQCLRFLAEAPDTAKALASRGRSYVLEHYGMDSVLDSLERTIEEWTTALPTPGAARAGADRAAGPPGGSAATPRAGTDAAAGDTRRAAG
ncbi:MAG: glycosyltransferase family 4 protein [Acidimicrobiales bacterium]